ncbi:hypothetical protein ABWW58_15950 [Sporolactobacillus sp. STCC-11]|uniref:hypothetical protein n=1 Tax=Sporolactobacillus caesalpiniae TaxID=3230362 RepID=UPI0033955E49
MGKRTYSPEFKNLVVSQFFLGKEKKEIIKKYSLSRSTLDEWINFFKRKGPF